MQLGNRLTFGGVGLANELANTHLSQQGERFMNTLGLQGQMDNPYLNAQIGGLQNDMQRALQASLGNIGQGFVGAGQYGGNRQGLAEGQAITGALEEFGQQAANLRSGDLSRQLQANQAGLQGALQQQQNQLAGQQAALSSLPQTMNLGLSPYTSQLGMLAQLGQIYGPPQTLTSSQSQSQSTTRGRGGDSFRLSILG